VRRDYIHLDDVVTALIAMSERPVPGVVNVAGGELTANGDIANLFVQAGWRVTFSRDIQPPAPPNADIGRLRALGVSPQPVKDVVRRYLERLNA
jgi:nucleoside-diphosphate-sugar epimerase